MGGAEPRILPSTQTRPHGNTFTRTPAAGAGSASFLDGFAAAVAGGLASAPDLRSAAGFASAAGLLSRAAAGDELGEPVAGPGVEVALDLAGRAGCTAT